MTAVEFALSLSHRNLYDLVLLNRLSCAMILDNDGAFTSHFATHVRSLEMQWSQFEVLKLELCNRPVKLASPHVVSVPRVL